MRTFRCTENNEIFSLAMLEEDFNIFKAESPSEYDGMTFGEYLNNCMTYNNGSLEEVKLFSLYRCGSVWKSDKHRIMTAWSEDDNAFIDMNNNRRYGLAYAISEDEVMTYARV